MLTYSIEKSRSVPLYEGLAEAIRQDIASGKIASGERLPSKRALAKNLGLSVMTVERAYEELEDEGFVVPSPRRGFFAACPGPRGVPKAPRATSPVRKSERQLLADFAGSGTEPEAFPFDAWSRIMRRELR
ncbi:MAG: GntR family transcriptional regulator, partial [Sutterellaceae bacterium]|nr:GntR family transcriptional regulator [Sutterellaceae bacterium]